MPVTITKEPPRQPEVIRLLNLSDTYMASLYPAESNHLLDVASLEKPGVHFFVARRQGQVLGCAALVEAGDGTAEIKRMFVDPQARGLSLGRALLAILETQALTLGLTAIRLETGISQPEAIGLYRKAGFADIEPFSPYLPDPLSLFMEKRLVPAA
ncbi:GNAT family N-acetyltransferase [Allorhizobium taibaishanense]|uniref:GNAT family N-acetyltransferase n=1 Tax=Allorhizobium taibaishanense TaxID=887144 RepID=A0A1Q9A1M6_9HYPH|nr:GNAT family N-acetyltransferase [Allorhizobium taibaishanense]MBB4008034.1 putative acetyltransferase [Allorhizobium taibaishanense]OLP48396.1 GNAT family N-acetyltransferase [Allorhizobium taibaishanense]